MTVAVGYLVNGKYRVATDLLWTWDTRKFMAPKIYRAGPWLVAESGHENLLTIIKRRLCLNKRVHNKDFGYLEDLVSVAHRECPNEECAIIAYHPDHGFRAVSENGRSMEPYRDFLAVGSGAVSAVSFIDGHTWAQGEVLSDELVEAAIWTAAQYNNTVEGYQLEVY